MGRTGRFREEALDTLQLDDLECQLDFIVLETDASDSKRTHRAFRQADQAVFVAAEDGVQRIVGAGDRACQGARFRP